MRALVAELAPAGSSVRLFGSRLDDEARGGDVDLLVDVPLPVERPAVLGAMIAARAMRVFAGRKVDVVLRAPNLAEQPIHRIAMQEGVLL
ncbi:DNA polymerase III subunit beta [Thauera sinica]|nr:DNA polymerase III subunit beta [Thauera sp. K11]